MSKKFFFPKMMFLALKHCLLSNLCKKESVFYLYYETDGFECVSDETI